MTAEPLELVSNTGPEVEVRAKETAVTPLPKAEDLLLQVNAAGETLRSLIVSAKRLPRDKGLEPHQDPTRSLALAQAHLQTGFMWLRRAIEAPKVF